MSYSGAVEKHHGDRCEQHPPLPCHRCAKLTLRAILAEHGAMCYTCYNAYCQEPQQPSSSSLPDKRRDGPKAWAYALKAREAAGERLSSAQRTMWRAALHVRAPVSTEEMEIPS